MLAVYDPATGAWSGIGSNGAGDGAFNNIVIDITWYNGILYAAGQFTNAGGVVGANYLAAWNGSSWTRRGGAAALNGAVYSLTVTGGVLLVGGTFSNASGDATADKIAYFDGYSFHGLVSSGAGVGVTVMDWVERLGSRIDVLLKPMEGLLAETPGIAGTTLMGDGRVALIANIDGIADHTWITQLANVVTSPDELLRLLNVDADPPAFIGFKKSRR